MGVQKFSAERIFDGSRFLPEGTVVVVDERRTVADLLPAAEVGEEVQHLRGILLPGLINAHCHLELSHFKGQIEPGGGLVKFLLSVVSKRKGPWNEEWKKEQIRAAAAEIKAAGVAGIGDICNTADAINIKVDSGLHWHNMVEVLNFSDETLAPRMAHNQNVLNEHLAQGLHSSVLTAHAPYSVSRGTFEALNRATAGKVISVHNQETAAETELFIQGTGDFLQLYGLTGTEPLGGTGRSSLQTWLPHFTEGQTVLLVHNTFMQKEDVQFAKSHAAQHGLNLFFCLCPNANLYIEEKLPPLDMFVEEGCTLLLGTDSYSSNWQLNIAAEIKVLAEHFPTVPLEVLLTAATRNGAQAFGWEHMDQFKKNSKAGLTLLHTDALGRLTGTSERIV